MNSGGHGVVAWVGHRYARFFCVRHCTIKKSCYTECRLEDMAWWLGSGIGTLHFSVFGHVRRRLTKTSISSGPRLEGRLQATRAVFANEPHSSAGHGERRLRAVIVPSPPCRRR